MTVWSQSLICKRRTNEVQIYVTSHFCSCCIPGREFRRYQFELSTYIYGSYDLSFPTLSVLSILFLFIPSRSLMSSDPQTRPPPTTSKLVLKLSTRWGTCFCRPRFRISTFPYSSKLPTFYGDNPVPSPWSFVSSTVPHPQPKTVLLSNPCLASGSQPKTGNSQYKFWHGNTKLLSWNLEM